MKNMKNSADLGRRYPPRPSVSVDNTLLDLQNSSYPTQSHSIIAEYYDTTIAAYESCYTSENKSLREFRDKIWSTSNIY